MNCKYCEIEIKKANKPNITGACRKCKYKHYREIDPGAQMRRWNRNLDHNRKRHSEWYQKWKKEKPEMYKARLKRRSASLSGRFIHGKTKAKRFNQEWSLTREQYEKVVDGNCHYCNGALSKTGSGLDRKDCAIGYTVENVVPCCGPCNRIKREILTHDEMIVAMKAVTELRASRT